MKHIEFLKKMSKSLDPIVQLLHSAAKIGRMQPATERVERQREGKDVF
jgi:hypothetical protein